MIYRITTLEEARTALDDFNGFHDGFIRELSLRSHDRFEARGVHTMTGRLDLDILFSHYNYRDGEPPADQLVRASFQEVRDLVTDIPHHHGEWSIDRVEMDAATRRSAAGEESCLVARIVHHRLVAGAWTTGEGVCFTFAGARLEELFG